MQTHLTIFKGGYKDRIRLALYNALSIISLIIFGLVMLKTKLEGKNVNNFKNI